MNFSLDVTSKKEIGSLTKQGYDTIELATGVLARNVVRDTALKAGFASYTSQFHRELVGITMTRTTCLQFFKGDCKPTLMISARMLRACWDYRKKQNLPPYAFTPDEANTLKVLTWLLAHLNYLPDKRLLTSN